MRADKEDGRIFDTAKNRNLKTVISLLAAAIDMYLVVSLEEWTKSAGRGAVIAFTAVGFAVCVPLIDSFLERQERRLVVHSLLWGALMAAAYVLGCLMRRDGTALAGLGKLPGLIAQIACLTLPVASCIAFLLCGRKLTGIKRQHSHVRLSRLREKPDGVKKYREYQVWLIYSAVIFLCWLPVFLAYYPSVFAYDAEGQLYQVIAHDYSTHHPLLHTLFLGAFFWLGDQMPGSYSAGMAVHSVVQMLLMACAFGYTLMYLYRRGVSAYLRTALLFFYALFPANSILALSTTKDVLFSALALIYTISVYRMVSDDTERHGVNNVADDAGVPAFARNDFNAEQYFVIKDWAAYVLICVLMLLFRNNAVYAYVLSVPVIYLGLRRGKSSGDISLRRRYLIASAAALILFAAGSMTLKAVLDAQNGSPREMLSIPLQQMARTRVKAEDTLSPEMRQELEKYLPSEWVLAAYDPYLADPVKNRAVIHDDPAGLIRTWIKLGTEYPQIYIDAFLDNSIGYWFLEDQTHAQIYGIGTESGFGYLSTDNRRMPAGCEIVEHSYLPGLRAAMERIVSDNAYRKLPVIRVIFAPAFYWWMLCMYIAVVIYRRRYRLLLPVVFFLFYYLTLLLSPTVLIRYMYPFVVTVPAICCCLSRELDAYEGKIYNKN